MSEQNTMAPQGDVCNWYKVSPGDDRSTNIWDVDCITQPMWLDAKIIPGKDVFNFCPNCGRRASNSVIDLDRLATQEEIDDTDKIVKFRRENRYLVLKIKDIEKYLNANEIKTLMEYAGGIELRRSYEGRRRLVCVVVEDDWPEYKQVWDAITKRCLGFQA